MQTRVLGRWLGVAAGAMGLAGWIFAFSIAMDMSGTSFRTVVFFVMMLFAIGGVTVSAHQYNDGGGPFWRSLLVVAALLLMFGTVLSGFTVGLVFLPAAVAAMAAIVFTFVGHAAQRV